MTLVDAGLVQGPAVAAPDDAAGSSTFMAKRCNGYSPSGDPVPYLYVRGMSCFKAVKVVRAYENRGWPKRATVRGMRCRATYPDMYGVYRCTAGGKSISWRGMT